MTRAEGSDLYDYEPEAGIFAAEVAGLQQTIKTIAPKYFYDERGSQLFDAITQLPEYYPTRTELALFERYLPEVKQQVVAQPFCVVEYGSGSNKNSAGIGCIAACRLRSGRYLSSVFVGQRASAKR